MDSNQKTPFSHIYNELFRKLNGQGLYQTSPKTIIPLKPSSNQNDSSIDDILAVSSEALFDKVMNTALAIISRLKIHRYINYRLDYQSLYITNKVLELSGFYNSRDSNIEQLKNAFTSEILKLEQQKLQEKVTCWRDLLEPMRYFLNLFFQHKELQNDRKLLEEE